MNNNKHYRKWMIQAPLGLVILGFGVCLVAESAMLKASGASWMEWVPAGTIALCVFGNSILERVRYERELEGEKLK